MIMSTCKTRNSTAIKICILPIKHKTTSTLNGIDFVNALHKASGRGTLPSLPKKTNQAKNTKLIKRHY